MPHGVRLLGVVGTALTCLVTQVAAYILLVLAGSSIPFFFGAFVTLTLAQGIASPSIMCF